MEEVDKDSVDMDSLSVISGTTDGNETSSQLLTLFDWNLTSALSNDTGLSPQIPSQHIGLSNVSLNRSGKNKQNSVQCANECRSKSHPVSTKDIAQSYEISKSPGRSIFDSKHAKSNSQTKLAESKISMSQIHDQMRNLEKDAEAGNQSLEDSQMDLFDSQAVSQSTCIEFTQSSASSLVSFQNQRNLQSVVESTPQFTVNLSTSCESKVNFSAEQAISYVSQSCMSTVGNDLTGSILSQKDINAGKFSISSLFKENSCQTGSKMDIDKNNHVSAKFAATDVMPKQLVLECTGGLMLKNGNYTDECNDQASVFSDNTIPPTPIIDTACSMSQVLSNQGHTLQSCSLRENLPQEELLDQQIPTQDNVSVCSDSTIPPSAMVEVPEQAPYTCTSQAMSDQGQTMQNCCHSDNLLQEELLDQQIATQDKVSVYSESTIPPSPLAEVLEQAPYTCTSQALSDQGRTMQSYSRRENMPHKELLDQQIHVATQDNVIVCSESTIPPSPLVEQSTRTSQALSDHAHMTLTCSLDNDLAQTEVPGQQMVTEDKVSACSKGTIPLAEQAQCMSEPISDQAHMMQGYSFNKNLAQTKQPDQQMNKEDKVTHSVCSDSTIPPTPLIKHAPFVSLPQVASAQAYTTQSHCPELSDQPVIIQDKDEHYICVVSSPESQASSCLFSHNGQEMLKAKRKFMKASLSRPAEGKTNVTSALPSESPHQTQDFSTSRSSRVLSHDEKCFSSRKPLNCCVSDNDIISSQTSHEQPMDIDTCTTLRQQQGHNLNISVSVPCAVSSICTISNHDQMSKLTRPTGRNNVSSLQPSQQSEFPSHSALRHETEELKLASEPVVNQTNMHSNDPKEYSLGEHRVVIQEVEKHHGTKFKTHEREQVSKSKSECHAKSLSFSNKKNVTEGRWEDTGGFKTIDTEMSITLKSATEHSHSITGQEKLIASRGSPATTQLSQSQTEDSNTKPCGEGKMKGRNSVKEHENELHSLQRLVKLYDNFLEKLDQDVVMDTKNQVEKFQQILIKLNKSLEKEKAEILTMFDRGRGRGGKGSKKQRMKQLQEREAVWVVAKNKHKELQQRPLAADTRRQESNCEPNSAFSSIINPRNKHTERAIYMSHPIAATNLKGGKGSCSGCRVSFTNQVNEKTNVIVKEVQGRDGSDGLQSCEQSTVQGMDINTMERHSLRMDMEDEFMDCVDNNTTSAETAQKQCRDYEGNMLENSQQGWISQCLMASEEGGVAAVTQEDDLKEMSLRDDTERYNSPTTLVVTEHSSNASLAKLVYKDGRSGNSLVLERNMMEDGARVQDIQEHVPKDRVVGHRADGDIVGGYSVANTASNEKPQSITVYSDKDMCSMIDTDVTYTKGMMEIRRESERKSDTKVCDDEDIEMSNSSIKTRKRFYCTETEVGPNAPQAPLNKKFVNSHIDNGEDPCKIKPQTAEVKKTIEVNKSIGAAVVDVAFAQVNTDQDNATSKVVEHHSGEARSVDMGECTNTPQTSKSYVVKLNNGSSNTLGRNMETIHPSGGKVYVITATENMNSASLLKQIVSLEAPAVNVLTNTEGTKNENANDLGASGNTERVVHAKNDSPQLQPKKVSFGSGNVLNLHQGFPAPSTAAQDQQNKNVSVTGEATISINKSLDKATQKKVSVFRSDPVFMKQTIYNEKNPESEIDLTVDENGLKMSGREFSYPTNMAPCTDTATIRSQTPTNMQHQSQQRVNSTGCIKMSQASMTSDNTNQAQCKWRNTQHSSTSMNTSLTQSSSTKIPHHPSTVNTSMNQHKSADTSHCPSSPCSTVSSCLFPVSSRELARRKDMNTMSQQQGFVHISNKTQTSQPSIINTYETSQQLELANRSNRPQLMQSPVQSSQPLGDNDGSNANHQTISLPDAGQLSNKLPSMASLQTASTSTKSSSQTAEQKVTHHPQMSFQSSINSQHSKTSSVLCNYTEKCPPFTQAELCLKRPLPTSEPLQTVLNQSVSQPPSTFVNSSSQEKILSSSDKDIALACVQHISGKVSKKRGKQKTSASVNKKVKKTMLQSESGQIYSQIDKYFPPVSVSKTDSYKNDAVSVSRPLISNSGKVLASEDSIMDNTPHQATDNASSQSGPTVPYIRPRSTLDVSVSALIMNLQTVQLIADSEVTGTNEDFSADFWSDNFTDIRMSETFWHSVDVW